MPWMDDWSFGIFNLPGKYSSMRNPTFSKSILIAGLLSVLTAWLLLALGLPKNAPQLMIGGLIIMAIACRAFPLLKGLSYTVFILAAVAASMFFPEFFKGTAEHPFKNYIKPLLILIMFGVGSTMSLKDFEGVIRRPGPVLIGVISQFTIMPLVGYTIAVSLDLPTEVAAGIILVGCVPSGLASNVMSYLANADVALSVTLTAVATLIAPIMTPMLMELLGGKFVQVSFFSMMTDILVIVILPIGMGLVFNHFLFGKAPWLNRTMPLLSMVSIGAIIAIITAIGRDMLVEVGLILVFACLLHNVAGYLLGYYFAKAFRMPEKSCRTVALEVGLQNGGLASALAIDLGKAVGLAPAIFGPLMNVTGSTLASWWHNKPVTDENN